MKHYTRNSTSNRKAVSRFLWIKTSFWYFLWNSWQQRDNEELPKHKIDFYARWRGRLDVGRTGINRSRLWWLHHSYRIFHHRLATEWPRWFVQRSNLHDSYLQGSFCFFFLLSVFFLFLVSRPIWSDILTF